MTTVAACVCTYRRHEPLARLLDRLAEIQAASPDTPMAVVVADDNPGASALAVTEQYAGRFALGVHHLVNGTQNISHGRNLVLAKGIELAEMIVMTDDDCLPEPQWVQALLATQTATGADAVTGPMLADTPSEAPRWISEQGLFGQLESFPSADEPIDHGQTNNCLITSAWLRANPAHRFDPALGTLGGEDMVFFRGAVQLGMRSFFSAAARVHAIEPLAELTLPALWRTYFWLGNSEAVTNRTLGTAGAARLLARGAKRSVRAAARPLARAVRGLPPHVRSATVLLAQGCGLLVGAVGVRVRHH